jgi:guanine nucleotide-binding protein subunit alpha
MGCGMSTEDKDGKARNQEIEDQLKRDRLSQRNEIKMLLLGECIPTAHLHRSGLMASCRRW